MCGIAAFLSNTPISSISRDCLPSLGKIEHRGPDLQDTFEADHTWLGHVRLSILDLSEAGNQPMVSACNDYVIVFNGEIYNHLELREEFLSTHIFRGHSDTETIIELFALMREEMLQHLVGMWTMIIYIKSENRVFITRDRFGQKPLYVRKNVKGWIFGSEMKLLGLGKEKTTFNPTAVTEFLSSGNYGHLGIETFYNEITQFPLASYTYLSHKDEYFYPKEYWALEFPKKYRKFGVKEKTTLKGLVEQAVLSQTLSDVPIGITLSGGIDSSIIAGILAENYKQKLHIFTAQTPGHKYDETKYVQEVIKKFDPDKIELHYIDLSELDFSSSINSYLKIQEEPFGDPSIAAHGMLMKAAKNAGVKVVLGGQGADEIFAGYDHALPSVLISQLKSLRLKTFSKNLRNLEWTKLDYFKLGLATMPDKLEESIKNKQRIKREKFIDPDWIKSRKQVKHANSVNYPQILKESLFGIHLPHLLHYDDRNAMSVSVEGRTPFLDHRIIEFLLQIHPSEFLKDGKRKHLLREACAEYLPSLIANRKDKVGFYTPLQSMLVKNKVEIDTLFKAELKGSMKEKLIADLAGLATSDGSMIKILRVFRVYSILKIKQIFNIEFAQ